MLTHRHSETLPKTTVSAFSFIEVLMAIAVSAIIFAALYSGIATTFNMLQAVRENLRATQIMLSRMEGLRLCAWSNDQLFNTNVVPPTFIDTFYPQGLTASSNSVNNGTVYYGTMTITPNPPTLTPSASYGTNLAKVTVTITWTNGGNAKPTAHTRKMSTFVAKYGVQNYIFYH